MLAASPARASRKRVQGVKAYRLIGLGVLAASGIKVPKDVSRQCREHGSRPVSSLLSMSPYAPCIRYPQLA